MDKPIRVPLPGEVTTPQISRSTEKERRMLREADFVHITGLLIWPIQSNFAKVGEPLISEEYRAHCFMESPKIIIVTSGGEVWMRYEYKNDDFDDDFKVLLAIKNSCYGVDRLRIPRIPGLFPTGTDVRRGDYLRRYNDPNCPAEIGTMQ